MEKITIMIVDDHQLIRETWSHILNAEPQFRVIAEFGNAEDAIDQAKTMRPNVVMLDVNLPGINGIEATKTLRKISPGSRILGISMHSHPAYAKQMIKNGALAYITKNASRQEMVHAIKETYAGRKYVGAEIRNILANQFLSENAHKGINDLSQRELEIVEFIRKGYSSKEIGAELFIAVKTVEVHRHNILKKLGLKNSASLVNFINKNYVGKE